MSRGKQHVDEELLIRFIVGETNEQEAEIVSLWLDASADNKAKYNALLKVWKSAASHKEVSPAEVNTDAAWNKLKSRVEDYAEIESKHKFKERKLSFYLIRVAAVLVIGFAIFSIYRYQSFNDSQVQLVSLESTKTNESLPDGTYISLNQNTIIQYESEFSESERRIKMSGEAFFDVKPDPERPFIIEAQEAVITVLGTSFNVKALAEDAAVEVLVEEGKVELSNTDKSASTILKVGEKGIYLKESNEVKKETDIDAESLYWLNKTLLFRDTKLSMVFATLEKLYDVEITVENKDILNCELTAKFSNETCDHIIDHISTIFELKTERIANKISVKGNGCQ